MVILIVAWLLIGKGSGTNTETADVSLSPQDATYSIEGVSVSLVKGMAEGELAPGSSSKITTRYFGNEVRGDFNGDGKEDVVFLLTQDMGGSGTFYYVAVALHGDKGYRGTNAVLLGDRIAPQTTEWRDGQIIVNYAVRNADEPMTARPSVGVSKYLMVSNDTLVEAKKDI